MARRIGILGGSFDPVHRGHLALADAAREAFALDEVRFMPCAGHRLKARKLSAAEDRCALLRLELARRPWLTLDCRELFRGGVTYTIDTLDELRAEHPGATLWLLLGMDSVCAFGQWFRAREILERCEAVAFDRPGVEAPEAPFDPRLLAHRLRGPMMAVSSTEAREALAGNAPVCYAIGKEALRYLARRRLY